MRILSLLLFSLAFNAVGWSQKGYQEMFSTPDFSVKSRWKPTDLRDKDSSEALFLSVENKSKYQQQVVFVLAFYLDGKRIEETEIRLCIRAFKKKFGRKDSLVFLPDYQNFLSDETADYGKGQFLEVEIEDFLAADVSECD